MTTTTLLLLKITGITSIGALAISGGFVVYTNLKVVEDIVDSVATNLVIDNEQSLTQTSLNNLVILEEGWMPNNIDEPAEGTRRIGCQLEQDASIQFCSLSKVNVVADKKWIDLTKLKAGTFIHDIPKDDQYINGDKTIYKARVTKAFIDAWKNDKNQKLNIFGTTDNVADIEPWITLKPLMAITTTKRLKGNVQYVLGKATIWTDTSAASSNPFAVEGKSFMCKLPQTGYIYQNCEFYLFDHAETANQTLTSHNLTTPLTKATSIKKDVYYLVKFDDEIIVNDFKYFSNQTLSVKVFDDLYRQVPSISGIVEIILKNPSSFIIHENDSVIEMAVSM